MFPVRSGSFYKVSFMSGKRVAAAERERQRQSLVLNVPSATMGHPRRREIVVTGGGEGGVGWDGETDAARESLDLNVPSTILGRIRT